MTTEEKVNTARLELQRVLEKLNVIDVMIDTDNKRAAYDAVEEARTYARNALVQLTQE